MFPHHVFRAYDIRGKAEEELSDALALELGRALGTFLHRAGSSSLALGRDCRLSSPRLHTNLRQGLLETGLRVVDVGVVPTPMVYFTVFDQELGGGVQVTGSHNPPEDNGFKMMKGKASLAGADIQQLRQMIEEQDFDLRPGGQLEEFAPLPSYCGFMRGNVRLGKHQVRVAVDAGNGAGGPTALAALKAIGIDPDALLCEPDGRFPVHHPDPSEEKNLELLRKHVLDNGLDLGIAYDGDADRIGVIDARGEIIWGDRLMVLFARSILERHPGAAVIGEVKCSQTLYDDIAAHGGRPILWRTGHSLIKQKIKEEKALLAGEMSGHMFFADRFFGFDDAVYATARLIEILSETGQPLHALLADLPTKHNTPELRVDCPDDAKFDLVERVAAHYRKTHDMVEVDGARIQFDGGWGLVRASNTQPVLVLRFEADSAERLSSIRDDVEQTIEDLR